MKYGIESTAFVAVHRSNRNSRTECDGRNTKRHLAFVGLCTEQGKDHAKTNRSILNGLSVNEMNEIKEST